MDKDEILEKNRRDNGNVDERFKLMEQRMGYVMMSAMMAAFVLLFLWDFFHGRETDGLCAVLMVGISAMSFTQFYQLRTKVSLFFGVFAALAGASWAVSYVLATM